MTGLSNDHLKGIIRLAHHLRAFDGEYTPIKTADRIEVLDIQSDDTIGWMSDEEGEGWVFIPAQQ